jgi:hypothetical protein
MLNPTTMEYFARFVSIEPISILSGYRECKTKATSGRISRSLFRKVSIPKFVFQLKNDTSDPVFLQAAAI